MPRPSSDYYTAPCDLLDFAQNLSAIKVLFLLLQ